MVARSGQVAPLMIALTVVCSIPAVFRRLRRLRPSSAATKRRVNPRATSAIGSTHGSSGHAALKVRGGLRTGLCTPKS